MSTRMSWPPYILAVAPNGARRTQADHPALPLTPAELARTAAACREAGACMLHLHVRDAAGAHTLDVDAYRAAIDAVRHAVGDRMIVQITTEAVGRYTPAQQMAVVRALRPEAVSLAIRELVPDAAAEGPAAAFLSWLRAEGIQAQYIVYSATELARFNDLRARGVVPPAPAFLLFVLGRYDAARASRPQDLLPFLAVVEEHDVWALCAFGRTEGICALTAALLEGHSRIGFENNMLLADGRLAPDNAALVAEAAAEAARIGRPLADADAARDLLADC